MLKLIFFSFLFAIACMFRMEGAQSTHCKITDNLNKDFIETMFKEVIEDLHANEETISHYFSPSYIQYVDGYQLDYTDFVQHMIVQKSLLDSIKVWIEHCVIENDAICTVHKVEAVKKNGEKLVIKVISYFKIEHGKIILCDELTHLLEGDEKNRNFGSIK